MKVIIQIPCLNEEATLPETLADLPRELEGVDRVEWLIVDDGSTDRTAEVARELGVDHIVRFPANRGLAAAFRAGLRASVEHGADIIVNTDADNQYRGEDIAKLVAPIVGGWADMVIGDRQIWKHPEFGFLKKCLQKFGSWCVSRLAGTDVADVTSGFRAITRDAALRMNILTEYTYTHESIIQAGQNHLSVVSVPIRVNPQVRPSRLFTSIPSYVRRSGATILRIYTVYRPLKVFSLLALAAFVPGLILGLRFIYFEYVVDKSGDYIQSLILCALLLNLSFIFFVLGALADLIGFNRRLLQELLWQARKLGQERQESEKSSSADTSSSS
jgi:glycosyltransferase involved in cell wall biosynthesis